MRVTFSQLSRTIELREDSTYQPKALKVDREASVIREAKLLGARSTNGNDYTDQALVEFAAKYGGVVSYVDHLPPGAKGRKVQDAWAWVVEGSAKARAGDGVYGDVRFNPKHPLAEQIVYFAEHKPDALGFSHDAQGRGRAQPNGRYLVEGAGDVASVDLVWKGATTRGLFEGATVKVKPGSATAKTLSEALLADRMAKGKLSAVFTTAMELVQAHLDDAGIDDAERLQRVMSVTDELQAEIKAMAGGEAPEEGDDPEAAAAPPKEEAMAESADMKKLQDELKQIREAQAAEVVARRRASRQQMLREAGLPAEGQLLETITAELDDAKAKALVEQVKPTTTRGPRSVVQTTEGAGAGTIPTGDALKTLGKSLGFKGR